MEVIIIHSVKVVGQCVGVWIQMEKKFPTQDKLELQIATSQVLNIYFNEILNAIIPSIPDILEKFARFCFCDSPYTENVYLMQFLHAIALNTVTNVNHLHATMPF